MSSTTRVALTKAQLSTSEGKALVDLCLEIGIDGLLADDELVRLGLFLRRCQEQIPAIVHLRNLVIDALADGSITDPERDLLHRQIERVLPPIERERLKAARKQVEQRAAEARRREREEEAERRRAEQEAEYERFNQPSEAQLRYIRGLGGALPDGATKEDASRLIDRLLNTNGSITPRQWMVLRFWNITPKPDWGKAHVSEWMDGWYSEDPNRVLAWEVFKEATGDTGTSRDPEHVPVGAGYHWLDKVTRANSSDREESSAVSVRKDDTARDHTGLMVFILLGLVAYFAVRVLL